MQPLPFALTDRVVLLATDGSPAAQAATLLADALATECGARIHVVAVADTTTSPLPPPLASMLAIADAVAGEGVHEAQRDVLRAHLSDTLGHACAWPVRVQLGAPAPVIAQEAARLDAALVVLGLRRHGTLERATDDETALGVIRSATCPVLGVSPDARGLPRRIVAAFDFGAASLNAARAARSLAAGQAVLALAYVAPVTGFHAGDGESVIHELGTQAGFARTAVELARPGLAIEHVSLPHELSHPAAALLLEYADDTGADLIAAGSARHSRVDRWMVGSVSTDIVRDGRRSVLIVPLPREDP